MWKNRLKPYDLLSGEDVEAIHEQAMTILEEIGVDASSRHPALALVSTRCFCTNRGLCPWTQT